MKKMMVALAMLLPSTSTVAFFGCLKRGEMQKYDIMYTVRTEGHVINKAYQVRLEIKTNGRKVQGEDIMKAFEEQYVQKHLNNGDIKAGQYKVTYQMNNWGKRTNPAKIRYLDKGEGIPKNMMADVHPIITML